MDEVRVIIAAIIFCICTYLVYDLFANGFNFWVLLAIIVGYTLVHYIWPRGKKEDSTWFDLLEIILDLPYKTFAFVLRSIGRLFRGGDGGVDIDI